MSDPDGGPSSSRSTRQRGVNSPRVATESPAMPINRDVRASESSEPSQASSGTPITPVAREVKLLNTSDYGGNLFTGPRSAKRETKKNSRFPPPVELQEKPKEQKEPKSGAAKLNEAPAAFEEKPKPTTTSPIRNLKETVKDKVGKLKTLATTDFSLPKWFGGKGAELNRRMPQAEWGKDSGGATRNKSVKRHSSVRRDPPPPPPSAALPGFNMKASTAASSPVKSKRGRSKLAGGTKAVMSKESEETVGEETPRGRRKTKGSEEIEKEKEKDEPMSRRESRGQKKKEKEKEATAELSGEDDEMEETALPVERPTKRAARKSRQIATPPPLPPAPVVAAVGRRRSSRGGTAAKEEEAKTKGDAQMVDESRPSSAQSSSAAVDRPMSRKRGRQSNAKAADSADNSQSTDEPPPKRRNTRRSLRSTADREGTEALEEMEEFAPVTHRSRRRTASEGENGGEKTEEDPPSSSPLHTTSPLPPGLFIPTTLAEALPNLTALLASEETTADSNSSQEMDGEQEETEEEAAAIEEEEQASSTKRGRGRPGKGGQPSTPKAPKEKKQKEAAKVTATRGTRRVPAGAGTVPTARTLEATGVSPDLPPSSIPSSSS